MYVTAAIVMRRYGPSGGNLQTSIAHWNSD